MRRILGTVLLVLTLLIPLGSSSYFTSCEESEQRQNATNNQRPKESCRSLDSIVVHAVASFVASYPNEISAAISAFAAIAIAFFTGTLWNATKDLRASTDKLWEASERHAERELRAFVFAKAVGVTPNTVTKAYTTVQGTYEVPVSWIVCVIWENSGGTRTKNMFSHVSHDFFDGEMPDDFAFPDLGDQIRVPTMIGPRSVIMSGAFEFKVSDQRVADVSAGKKHLYMWGWAEYDDIFDGTPRHRSEFCYELFFVGAFPVKAQLGHRMHRLHNAADDDCQYPLKTPRA